MGGFGSTRWGWHTKRQTVEDGLALDLSKLRRDFDFDPAGPEWLGSLRWTNTRTGEEAGSIGYTLHPDGDEAVMTLVYRVGGEGGTDIKDPVRLVTAPCNLGGRRWWFLCPRCGRRCGKLHLPPGARWFNCRVCHDLTYTSVQEHDARVDFFRRNPEAAAALLGSETLGGLWFAAFKAAMLEDQRMEELWRRERERPQARKPERKQRRRRPVRPEGA